MNKEMKIVPPEGYEIDKENSTFECIKFKPIDIRFIDDEDALICGYRIMPGCVIHKRVALNIPPNYDLFATKEYAESALAMARLSQIIKCDERFGGPITAKEWGNDNCIKFCIRRSLNSICIDDVWRSYHFLAFRTREQAELFKKENEKLIKQYYML